MNEEYPLHDQFYEDGFKYVIRGYNTNLDGRREVRYAFSFIKGTTYKYWEEVCESFDIDYKKLAGRLTTDEIETLIAVWQDYNHRYSLFDINKKVKYLRNMRDFSD